MKKIRISVCIAGALSLWAQQVMAVGQIDDKAGWGFKLYLNAAYGDSRSQFSTDSDNAVTSSLDSSGENVSGFALRPLVRLDYTLSDLKTQFFVGQGKGNVVRGQFQLEVGVSHMLGEKAFLELAYFPELPGFNKTWEDPYVTGIARSKTDQDTQGFRIRWQNAFDTPFTARYAYASTRIEDELSGQFLGLSLTERSMLERDGDYHRLTGEYDLVYGKKTKLTPLFSYTRGNTDGKALGYDGYQVGLEVSRAFNKRHFASVFVDYEHRRYLDSNPIFDQRQKDDAFGISATYAYKAPFGWKHTRIIALARYDRSSSNISFYESRGGGVAIGFGWDY
ncbi:MAG: DUF2860 domain-containing protein [Gammaproteobacteria bacterium]|nr:DUF2860 domain-containing protein [Gammaproteobacteria bacterium]